MLNICQRSFEGLKSGKEIIWWIMSNNKKTNRKYSSLDEEQKSIRRKSWMRIGKNFINNGPEKWQGRKAGRAWTYVVDFFQLTRYYTLFDQAASVVYYLLLAFFPILILTVYFVSLITKNLEISAELIEAVKNLMPGPILDITKSLAVSITAPLSVISLIISILTALWASSRGIGKIFKGISGVYPKKSDALPVPARIFGVILTIIFFIVLAFATLVMNFGRIVFDFINEHLHFLKFNRNLIDLMTYGFGFFLIFAILFILYFANTRRATGNIPSWPGALISSVVWILLSYIYSYYIANLANVTSLYGGLANIIILILWLNFTVQIILYGALINYQIAWYRIQKKDNYQVLNQIIKEIDDKDNPFEHIPEESLIEEEEPQE